MSASVKVAPARKYGQDGSYWGNLLLPEGELSVDDTFTFEGDDTLFTVKRVLVAPLEPSKRLAYYEKKKRFET